MNNINALIERLFDWRSTASRREFLNIFLAIRYLSRYFKKFNEESFCLLLI